MALIEPNSTIEFIRGIPFDPSYENTMYFDTLAQQETYFSQKQKIVFNKLSYQRVNSNTLKVGSVADNNGNSVITLMYNVSYMRFKNTNFENKWFYAFVDNVEYINNNTVEVRYHLDVLQTWHFDYIFNQCLIERQHTTTDNIGDNTVPENIEYGDYQISSLTDVQYSPVAVVVSSGDAAGDYADGDVITGLHIVTGSTTGDMFSGVKYYTFDISDASRLAALNTFLENAYTDRDRQNSIIAVFMGAGVFMQNNATPIEQTIRYHTFNSELAIGTYYIRNKKLMSYPYNMIYVTNYQGGHLELHYEYFTTHNENTQFHVRVWGNIGSNPGLVAYPVDYKGAWYNFDESLQLNGFPMCAWVNDAYKAWVAQNFATLQVNYASDIVNAFKGVTNVISGVSNAPAFGGEHSFSDAGGGLQQAYTGVGQIVDAARTLAKTMDASVMPQSAHGNSNGNLQYQSGKLTFGIGIKQIRAEYAKILDDFFDMYGYAIHRVGTPNRNARPCWTYVKTIGCSLDGNVPISDLRIIEEIFNKGVRFWRTTATFGSFDPNVNDNRPS